MSKKKDSTAREQNQNTSRNNDHVKPVATETKTPQESIQVVIPDNTNLENIASTLGNAASSDDRKASRPGTRKAK